MSRERDEANGRTQGWLIWMAIVLVFVFGIVALAEKVRRGEEGRC